LIDKFGDKISAERMALLDEVFPQTSATNEDEVEF